MLNGPKTRNRTLTLSANSQMNEHLQAIIELMQQDQRYHLEAYQFVREALQYAQKVMKMPAIKDEGNEAKQDHHLTGQQ